MFKFVHVFGLGFKGKLDVGRREAIWSAPEKKLGRGGSDFSPWQKVAPKKNLPGLFDRMTAAGI